MKARRSRVVFRALSGFFVVSSRASAYFVAWATHAHRGNRRKASLERLLVGSTLKDQVQPSTVKALSMKLSLRWPAGTRAREHFLPSSSLLPAAVVARCPTSPSLGAPTLTVTLPSRSIRAGHRVAAIGAPQIGDAGIRGAESVTTTLDAGARLLLECGGDEVRRLCAVRSSDRLLSSQAVRQGQRHLLTRTAGWAWINPCPPLGPEAGDGPGEGPGRQPALARFQGQPRSQGRSPRQG